MQRPRHPGENENPASRCNHHSTFAFADAPPRVAGSRGMSSARHQAGGVMLRLLIALFFLALLGASAYVWFDYRRFTDAPLTIEGANATIDVARGSSYRNIVD